MQEAPWSVLARADAAVPVGNCGVDLRAAAENGVDRWDGTTYRRVLPLDGVPVEVAVAQTAPPESPQLQVTVTGAGAGSAIKAAVSPILERMLGLPSDLSDFYRFASHDARLAALAERFRGMKPPQFPTVLPGVINGIACQQMSLTLGIRLLTRLSRRSRTGLERRRGTGLCVPSTGRPGGASAPGVAIAGIQPSEVTGDGRGSRRGSPRRATRFGIVG